MDPTQPFPADRTVDAGLQLYLDENGFTRAHYDEPRTKGSFLGIGFSVPNTPKHRWAIRLHDLHHVATGFGTDSAGEGQISAWETRRGLRATGFYVGSIVFLGMLLGLVVAPRKTLRAWRASRGGRSLFQMDERAYEDLLALTVGELRVLLEVPPDGLHVGERGRHSKAPALAD